MCIQAHRARIFISTSRPHHIQVYYILDTVLDALLLNKDRKFIYAETAFFVRWWDTQSSKRRDQFKSLVKSSQIEFVNGGWCMHDEAAPHYRSMIDQTTRGHQFLYKTFGDSGRPKVQWQIDPFGHSNTHAWLLSAEAGFEGKIVVTFHTKPFCRGITYKIRVIL